MAATGITPEHERRIERWFVARGVPHLIEGYHAPTDIWTRALPVLVVAYLLGGLNALDLREWSLARNLAAAVVVVAVLAIGWALTNALLRRPFWALPRRVGAPELVAFVVGPAVPSVLFGQWTSAARALVIGLVVLAVVYLGTSYAVLPVARWAVRTSWSQVAVFASLVARALPLLLLFTTFLFVNAEVWQVAGTLQGVPYVAGLGIFFLLGAVFVLSSLPNDLRGHGRFGSWDEVTTHLAGTPAEGLPVAPSGPPQDALSVRQRVNLSLVAVFSQALQITLVAVTVTGFFCLFGFISISESVQLSWTGADDIRVLASLSVSERELVLTEPLLRVAGFLGAFTGMYFTVVQTTDATYRDEFSADVGADLRQVLAVHAAYREAHA